MKKDVLLKKQALQFLSENRVMVVSTISSEGMPESAAVYYKLDPSNWSLYFMTDMSSQKFKNIQQNNLVSFVVGTGPHIFTIQGRGRAEVFLHDGSDFMHELGKKFELDLSSYWPVTKISHKNTAMMRITPEWLRVLNLEPTLFPETARKKFYQLIGE